LRIKSEIQEIMERYKSKDDNFLLIFEDDSGINGEWVNLNNSQSFWSYLKNKFHSDDWIYLTTVETISLSSSQTQVNVLLIPLKVLKNERLSHIISDSVDPEKEIELLSELAKDFGTSIVEVGQERFYEEIKEKLSSEYFIDHYGNFTSNPSYFDVFASDIYLIKSAVVLELI